MGAGPDGARIGYLGPEGTFSHAAALAGVAQLTDARLVPLATIHDVVMAVADATVDLGVVPLENSIEGSVAATLDTLAIEAEAVCILAEQIERIEQCLIAAAPAALETISTVLSHPQASAQCARFLQRRLPRASVSSTSSTAEAVRLVAERGAGWAALGPRQAAARYDCVLLAEGVEDRAANATRFVWLAREDAVPHLGAGHPGLGTADRAEGPATYKTSLVFWGDGSGRPGWLVRCLAELSDRGVNLTRIESRPRKHGLGLYMFFVDCEGTPEDPAVAAALGALAGHVEVLRVLGAYRAAPVLPEAAVDSSGG